MTFKSNWARNLVATAAALAMSSLAVGAAVGPAQAVIHPLSAPIFV